MARRTARVALALALAACAEPAPPAQPTPWELELRAISADIEAAAEHAEAGPADWLRRERLARLYLERAQRTGAIADYQAAEHALAQAFAGAPAGSGPVLAQAGADLALHRFHEARDGARTALARPLLGEHARAEALHIDALASIEIGELEGAATAVEAALALDPSPRAWADRALVARASGDETGWSIALDEATLACACPDTRFAAWVAWQRGLHHLEAGEAAEAAAWFTTADGHFPGDWVIEEHLAEALVLTGEPARAAAIYESILAERDAPVVWWGLAKARAALGQSDASALLRAEQGFEARLAAYPDAMAGHAVEFFADHGPPERAEALARRDAALRAPAGEAP